MQQRSEKQRPLPITVVCLLGFLGVIVVSAGLIMPTVRSQVVSQYGFAIIPLSVVSSFFGLAGLIGYWNMCQWGVYAYTISAFIGIGSGVLLGIKSGVLGYVLPIGVVSLGIIYFDRMNP